MEDFPGWAWSVVVGVTSGSRHPLVSSHSKVAVPGLGRSPWGPSEPIDSGQKTSLSPGRGQVHCPSQGQGGRVKRVMGKMCLFCQA